MPGLLKSLPCGNTKGRLSWGEATTVILRNIPNNCSRAKLLDAVFECGFAGTFDFFYLPCDYDTGANKGYAFLNFKLPMTAKSFEMAFQGKRLRGFKSQKILLVEIASVQGFQANYDHFQNNNRMLTNLDPEFQPLFIVDHYPAKVVVQEPVCCQDKSLCFDPLGLGIPVKVDIKSLSLSGVVNPDAPLFLYHQKLEDSSTDAGSLGEQDVDSQSDADEPLWLAQSDATSLQRHAPRGLQQHFLYSFSL